MTEDIDIEVWISKCLWCPNIDSASQMQLDYRLLVKQDGSLCIARPNGMWFAVLDYGITNRLLHLLEAGVEIDVHILDSIPEKKAILVSIYVSGEEIDVKKDEISNTKKKRQSIKATARAEELRLTNARRARSIERRRKAKVALLFMPKLAYRWIAIAVPKVAKAIIKTPSLIRKLWSSLVDWTNKE